MKHSIFLAYVFFLLIPSFLLANSQIKVVGSGTVYPLATLVAENFISKNPKFQAPIVESIGTGGGFKMFCSGNGLDTPDINNASRKIKPLEKKLCNQNNVNDVLEITLGYDSIVLIQSKETPQINLTSEEIFLGLASQVPSSTGSLISNPYKNWNEIDKSLPNMPIKIMGPASLSGTRDTFIELVMEKACHNLYNKGSLKVSKEDLDRVCKSIRVDGAYINGGENYILFIQKVASSHDTLAILGYSFYEQNESRIQALKIDGIAPNKESFNNKTYPLFRPLYIYVKKDRIGLIRGLKEFIEEITSKEAIGQNGYLKRAGLIPLQPKEYNEMIKRIRQ